MEPLLILKPIDVIAPQLAKPANIDLELFLVQRVLITVCTDKDLTVYKVQDVIMDIMESMVNVDKLVLLLMSGVMS